MEENLYPLTHRRVRASAQIRELTATVKLSYKSFIQQLFVEEKLTSPKAVAGLAIHNPESIVTEIEENLQKGISKFLLFPIPSSKTKKDFNFSFVTSVIQTIKQKFKNDVWLACDLCLCSYTQH